MVERQGVVALAAIVPAHPASNRPEGRRGRGGTRDTTPRRTTARLAGR
jgi:hypothetical protein